MAFLNLYKNSPTAGGTDGSLVVTGNPIITPYLDLTTSATVDIKLALRCDTGYTSTGDTTITPTAAATTLSAQALATATTISVTAATGLQVGNRIQVGTETKRITVIDGTTLTIDTALVGTQASGAAVVCQSKYQIALALDDAGVAGTFGDYGAALTFTSAVDATNTIIWARFRAQAVEAIPYNDIAASLTITATVGEA